MALSSAPSTMIPSTNNSIHHSGFNFTRRLISSVTASTVFIESKITRNHLGPSSVEDNVLNIVNFEENSNESRTRTFFGAASIMRPLSRGRPRDNSAVHGASEDVPGMTYDVPGVSYPIPWTSGDCPQGVRPADGPGTHSLASTGPFSQAAVHRASGLLRFSQSQRGRIMDRKWGCPQYVRNRKLMSRSCPGNATATLLAALTFFVKNKLILL